MAYYYYYNNEEMETLEGRLDYLRRVYCGGSNKEMAEKLECPETYLSSIVSGKVKPGSRFLTKVCATFPGVKGDWLVHGVGEPPKTEYQVEQDCPVQNPASDATHQIAQYKAQIELLQKRLEDKEEMIKLQKEMINQLLSTIEILKNRN